MLTTTVFWTVLVSTGLDTVELVEPIVVPVPTDPPKGCEDIGGAADGGETDCVETSCGEPGWDEADNFFPAKWAPRLPPTAARTIKMPTATKI